VAAKAHFITQVSNLIKESKLNEVVRSGECSNSDSENDLNMFSIFGSSKCQRVFQVHGAERDTANDSLRCAENEVQSYLLATNGVSHKTDIFAWWNKSKTSFPTLQR